jgi:hypothetical protein
MTNNAGRRKSDADVTSCLCHRFGAIAVFKGFVNIDEVKAAIMEQVEDDLSGREHRLLGSILFERGLITEHQIETVMLELRKQLK